MVFGVRTIGCLSSMLLLAGASMVRAQGGSNATFADFQGLSSATPVQVRLTYIAALQDEAHPSLILVVAGQKAAQQKFQQFERSGVEYPSATVNPTVKEVSAAGMSQIIANLGGVPAVVNSMASSSPWVSLAILNVTTSKGSEAILDKTEATAALKAISDALASSDASAAALILELGCSIGAVGPERPTDVTASMTANLSGIRLNRSTGNFVSRLTLTNTSGAAIASPISVAFLFNQPNITLPHKTGTTCSTTPPGLEYVNVDLEGGSLAAGASVDVLVEFTNSERHAIAPTFKLLAGSGAR